MSTPQESPQAAAPPGAPSGRPTSTLAWPLLIAITFLTTIGMTIVFPVLPFILREYVPEASLALWVGVLESVYALCAFIAAPFLGSFSDRFGRKPILVISVLGSAAGYLMFGIGGALWVLLVSRIIDGLTAGDLPVMFAYLADITPPEDRAKRYGLLGALGGIGTMVGPAIGAFLATISLSAPVFATAAIAALIGLLSAFLLPESLKQENRTTELKLAELHPFTVISAAFGRKELRALLIAFTLVSIPFAFFVNNVSVLALDAIQWGPTQVGLLLSGVGVVDIIIQGALLGPLVKRFGERGVVVAGMVGQLIGCLGLALVASLVPLSGLLASAALMFAAGQGGMQAALDGVMSSSVGADEQGWLAGGMSSLGSAVQMTAPLLAGWLYGISHGAPYWLSVGLIALAAFTLAQSTRRTAAADVAAIPA
ncbi:MAG TPA: MFS transporter [Propionicimonas sp.]|jgi:DHA1 family tetracycline resistance protein-like MFS transporter|uniref:MFS transporter n=1 Tax=Propionicimonas sp. TaxID=1955623 RepID=UPI002F3FBF12